MDTQIMLPVQLRVTSVATMLTTLNTEADGLWSYEGDSLPLDSEGEGGMLPCEEVPESCVPEGGVSNRRGAQTGLEGPEGADTDELDIDIGTGTDPAAERGELALSGVR